MSELEVITILQEIVVTTEVAEVVIQVEEHEIVISDRGAQGPPGPPGPSGAEFLLTAAVPLGGLRAVTGGGVYADQGNIDQLLGVTLEAGTTGAQVRVRSAGILEDPSWAWTPGAPIYVGAAGVLTQTSPAGLVRRIATAVTATKVVIDIFPPIQTAA